MKIHFQDIFLLAVLALSCTACSLTEEAMDGQEAGTVAVVEDGQMERPQDMESYTVFRAVPKSGEMLARPELFFPEGSDYMERTDIEEDVRVWEDTQGNNLALDKNGIRYSTSNYFLTYADLLYDEDGGFRRNFDDLLTEGTVDTVSEEAASELVTGLAGKMDIAFCDAVAYPLSVENMTKLSRLFMSDEEYEEYLKVSPESPLKRSFEEAEEAYLVVLVPCVKEWPLYHEEYDYGERFYPACCVWGIVSSNGLEWFEASGLYDVEDAPAREIPGMTVEQAKERLQRRFEGIMGEQVVDCTKIELTYLAAGDGVSGKVELIPAFVFYLNESFTREKQAEAEEITMQDTLILDIETGNWVE